jgi:serine protease
MHYRACRILSVSLALLLAIVASAAAQDGRYIVKFRDGRGPAGHAALRAAGAEVVLALDPQNAAAARIPAAALNGLSRNPNIEYIEVDVIREPYANWSNSTLNGQTTPYGLKMVQAGQVVSDNPGGVKLCIIDSGYSDQHNDLRNLNDGVAFTATGGTGTWNKDSCGHGTHVAGTIAASNNSEGVIGVNPGASLHIVKVFGNDSLVENGACNWTYSSALTAALNACVDAGAKVVSMSLGGGARSRTEENAFNTAANSKHILSIAAAGNAGNGSTSYPAGYASVMSVAAVDANEARASFSQRNSDVEIAAPGVAVLSTTPWLDVNTLAASGKTWSGGRIEGAGRGSIAGVMVNGGRCTTSSATWANKVVLCERGDNTFAQKVNSVQGGGGIAAVIYNNASSDATCGVYSGTLGDGVTSAFRAITLSCADGAAAVAAASSTTTGTVSSAFSTPNSGYEAWDGTSMATPHVSAIAALIWSCDPGKSNAAVRNALTSTAVDRGAAGRDSSFGYGIVQAAEAAKKLIGSSSNGVCTVY